MLGFRKNDEYERFISFMSEYLDGREEFTDMLQYLQTNRKEKETFIFNLFRYWQQDKFEWYLMHYLLEYEKNNKK